ncbi:hypothetical protein CPB85DRAFT_1263240 [Mucidula mucida]|nr:hypothetical protein CPB85DRAFT_1263240 [Mucidula mucida]
MHSDTRRRLYRRLLPVIGLHMQRDVAAPVGLFSQQNMTRVPALLLLLLPRHVGQAARTRYIPYDDRQLLLPETVNESSRRFQKNQGHHSNANALPKLEFHQSDELVRFDGDLDLLSFGGNSAFGELTANSILNVQDWIFHLRSTRRFENGEYIAVLLAYDCVIRMYSLCEKVHGGAVVATDLPLYKLGSCRYISVD